MPAVPSPDSSSGSSPSDPLLILQAAARRCGRHAMPGVVIRRVILVDDANRRVVDVAVPPAAEGDGGGERRAEQKSGREAERPPLTLASAAAAPRPGWDFSETTPRFDGVPVPIHGRKADLLRVLAEYSGPASVEVLKTAWGGYPIEEGTVRWTLGELKKTLKEQFPGLEGEAITNGPGGYTLVIR